MKKISKILFFLIFALLFFNSKTMAGEWKLPGINIISRAERGANEDIRYTSYPTRAALEAKKKAEADEEAKLKAEDPIAYEKKKAEEAIAYSKTAKAIANAYLKNNYYNDVSVDATVSTYNGHEVERKQSYKYSKTKIIIHHTAGSNTGIITKKDAIENIKSIYKYHTLTNGWGDIGYNFLIDPFGNIYEGRAGGEGVIGAHAKRNNTPSVGIALLGNFNDVEPTKEALDSLIKLVAALADKYDIDPLGTTTYHKDSKTSPYIETKVTYTIAGHKDAGVTSCPGKNMYELLPYIRASVHAINAGTKRESAESLGFKSQAEYLQMYSSGDDLDISAPKDATIDTKTDKKTSTKKTKLTYKYFDSLKGKINSALNEIKRDYVSKNNISYATNPIQKINGKIDIQKARNYLNQNINVLLYELTQKYDRFEIACNDGCVISYDFNFNGEGSGEVIRKYSDSATVIFGEDLELQIEGETISPNSISIESNNNIVTVQNYDRKSYAGVPRNTFHGALLFKKDYMKDEKGNQMHKYVVINSLGFDEYMKGIVETNDTESQTKNEVMSLIAKSYALFYMDPVNQHPNIPQNATYNAVDNPNIFQKYVGAGLEDTLKKWYKALDTTKNELIMFDGYVPILPYFSCSAGFTYSASEKRGWTDTPYLQSKYDIGICDTKDFSGHGVGLCGLGAERRATLFGRSRNDILNYYYPGISIITMQ